MGLIKSVKIKSIKYIGKHDVYNMEVKNHHNFSVNGGLIVHNCYDGAGYGLISWHTSQSKPPKEEKNRLQRHKEKLIKKRKMIRKRAAMGY